MTEIFNPYDQSSTVEEFADSLMSTNNRNKRDSLQEALVLRKWQHRQIFGEPTTFEDRLEENQYFLLYHAELLRLITTSQSMLKKVLHSGHEGNNLPRRYLVDSCNNPFRLIHYLTGTHNSL